MNITVNGQSVDVQASGVTLDSFLRGRGIVPETVAVEMNLNIIPKNAYPETILSEGDRIEVVRYVGGGC